MIINLRKWKIQNNFSFQVSFLRFWQKRQNSFEFNQEQHCKNRFKSSPRDVVSPSAFKFKSTSSLSSSFQRLSLIHSICENRMGPRLPEVEAYAYRLHSKFCINSTSQVKFCAWLQGSGLLWSLASQAENFTLVLSVVRNHLGESWWRHLKSL